MLVLGLLYLFFGFVLSLIYSLNFSLIISLIVFSFVFLLMGGYVNFLGYSFVSFIVSVDYVSISLVLLRVWVSMLILLVRFKYFYLNNFPYFFVLSVYLLMIIVILFFIVDSLFVFYLMFEFSLFPTLFLILK